MRGLRHIVAACLLSFLSMSMRAQTDTTALRPNADTTLIAMAHPVNDVILDSLSIDSSRLADEILNFAYKFEGYPYVWAANGPHAFDCSGFTSFVYRQFGYKLGRMAGQQARNGIPVEGDLSNAQKGDLIIFAGSDYRHYYGHVGIVTGLDEDGRNLCFIHAANPSKGVIVSSTREAHYHERFKCLRRIIPDAMPLVDQPMGEWHDLSDSLSSSSDCAYILSSDGRWTMLRNETMTVPNALALDVPEASRIARPSSSEADPDTRKYHTIRSGDTLSGIASKYHTSVKKLCSLNGMTATSILKIGKKIRVI